MKVLITGAGGFFGRALVRQFALSGDDVVAADVMPEDEFSPRKDTPQDRLSYVQLDVANEDHWTSDRTGPVEGIVHAAALTPSVDEMKQTPKSLVSVNLVGTLNALEFAQKHDIQKFLFISSGGVYDQFTEVVLHEEDGDGGFSLYGSAKLAAEIMLFRYAEMFGFDAGAVRPTSMYGPAEEFRGTRPFVTQIKTLVDAARNGETIRADGLDARCDWIYVDDVAEAAYNFFSSGMDGQSFNLSSGNPIPFSVVVAAVQDVFGLQVADTAEQSIDGSPDRPTVISPDNFIKEFGWSPPPLEDGLRRYLEALEQ